MSAVDAEIASYAGLPEPPPYTPWFVDSFRDAVDARTTQREIAQRSFDQAKDQATTAAQELKKREGEYSVANEKFTMNTDAAQRPVLDLVVARLRALLRARLSFVILVGTDQRVRVAAGGAPDQRREGRAAHGRESTQRGVALARPRRCTARRRARTGSADGRSIGAP